MRVIKGGPEQRAALEATRELTGELLHSTNSCQLGHVLLQHVEIFEQQRAFVFQRRLKRFAPVHCIFDLAKDPGVGHRAAANQNSVAAGIAKAIESLLNCGHVAAA
jgi:hypothetical protein